MHQHDFQMITARLLKPLTVNLLFCIFLVTIERRLFILVRVFSPFTRKTASLVQYTRSLHSNHQKVYTKCVHDSRTIHINPSSAYLFNYNTSQSILCSSLTENIWHSFCYLCQHFFVPVIKFNLLSLSKLVKFFVGPVSRNTPIQI